MTDYRSMLERETRRFDPPADPIERLYRRGERAQRNRRISAGVTALVVTVVAAGVILRAFGPLGETRPADDPDLSTVPVPTASDASAPFTTAPAPARAFNDVVATLDAVSLSPGDDLELDGPDATIDGDQGGRDLTWDGTEFENPKHLPPGPAFAQAIVGTDFDSVTGEDLAGLPWSRATYASAPGLDAPIVGAVFGVWTNGSNYAKVEVLELDGETIRIRAVTYRGVDAPCLVKEHPFEPWTDAHGDTVVRASDRLVVCGTWTFDLDTGTEGGDTLDLWWEQIDGVHAMMRARAAGVGLADLGAVDFDGLTRDDLRALDLSAASIDGWPDDRNQLAPGDVFAVRTSDGNLAKVQVLRYGYDLELRYVTYAGGSS